MHSCFTEYIKKIFYIKWVYVYGWRNEVHMKKMFFIILCLLGSFFELAAQNRVPQPHQLPKKVHLRSLERKARKDGHAELLRAIQRTRLLLEKYKHPGIKKRRFLQAALYIENQFPQIQTPDKKYLTRKKTKIKHAIEYEPNTKHIFIVLDSKKAFLGKGAKKQVYKAIRYGSEPKVVARSEQTHPMNDELKAYQTFQNMPGIVNTYAFTSRKVHGKKYRAVYSDLYENTLQHLLEKKKIGLKKRVILMNDLLAGLEALHSRGFVHRDLHSANFLLRTERDGNGKKMYRGAIADLGRTLPIEKVKQLPAQMTRKVCAPEGFTFKKLKKEDYFATDIYALGNIFYRMYFYRKTPWYKQSHWFDSLSQKKKKTHITAKLKKETSKRRKALLRKKARLGTLSVKQDLELLILKMVHHNPKERGSAKDLKQAMGNLLYRIKK